MTFHIGQKVVCVDSDSPSVVGSEKPPNNVRKGAIYTIREMGHDLGHDWVLLAEVRNEPNWLGWEWAFSAARFRPVTERKTETGMAILHKILDCENHQDKPPVKRTAYS